MMTRSPGSISRFMRTHIAAAKRQTAQSEVNVPCQGCTACCRSGRLVAALIPSEHGKFDEVDHPESGRKILRKREDGSCVYFTDGGCSIYNERPHSCRTFDCRWSLVIAGWDHEDKIMHEALAQWGPMETKTYDDKVLWTSIRLAINDGPREKHILPLIGRALNYAKYTELARSMVHDGTWEMSLPNNLPAWEEPK